ncbi:MAG: hypothetical protein GY772_27960, partial [bacterium]|nr:hypothetical protein [bacterium]
MEGDDFWEEAGGSSGSGHAAGGAQSAAAARPSWMIMDNGYEYCTLCRKYATEEHLASAGHHGRLDGWNVWGAGSSAAVAGSPDLAGDMPDEPANPGGVAALLAEGFLPPGSGDPLYYRWDGAFYYCRLCWKHVDEGHLRSLNHRRRMPNALRILFSDPEVGHIFRARAGNPQLTWPQSMMAELPARARVLLGGPGMELEPPPAPPPSLLAVTTPWSPG